MAEAGAVSSSMCVISYFVPSVSLSKLYFIERAPVDDPTYAIKSRVTRLVTDQEMDGNDLSAPSSPSRPRVASTRLDTRHAR